MPKTNRWLVLIGLGTLAVTVGLTAAGWAVGNMIKWRWAPWFLLLQVAVGLACAIAGFWLWAKVVLWTSPLEE